MRILSKSEVDAMYAAARFKCQMNEQEKREWIGMWKPSDRENPFFEGYKAPWELSPKFQKIIGRRFI